MKILYLINHAGKAGTEKYVLNLVNAFNEKQAKCYFAYNEAGLLSQQMADAKIVSFQFEMKHPFDLKAAKTLAGICRENKIDVIHAQYPRECYIAVLSRLFYNKTKVVFTSHLTLENNLPWKITNFFVTPFIHRTISVCNHGKNLLIGNKYPKNKIDVIFNGVVPEEVDKTKSTIRDELGLSEDTFVVSILARFFWTKGLDFLVEATAELDKLMKRPYAVLVAGDGELFDEIKKMASDKGLDGKFICLGFRKDTKNILWGSDIYVNTSLCHEALSFAILEGLNADLPCVVTNRGGNADIINDTTACGKLVEFGDAKGFAKAMYDLAEDKELYDTCVTNARKAIREIFDLDIICQKTFDVYKKVMNIK